MTRLTLNWFHQDAVAILMIVCVLVVINVKLEDMMHVNYEVVDIENNTRKQYKKNLVTLI